MPDNLRVLNFDGDTSIASITKWYDLVSQNLAQGANCILNFARSTDPDLSTIQLVIAAKKQAGSLGLNCQVAQNSSQDFLDIAFLCGITSRADLPAKQLDQAFDEYLGTKV